MGASDSVATLATAETQRLADFARACKAAARVVALYPTTHPAIQTSLSRVSETAARLRGQYVVVLTVLPDSLLLDGQAAAKPDAALDELAALLHAHLIGELRLAGDLAASDWHAFLSLVARPAEEVRAEGGIARTWLAAGNGAIELRQIDYSEVLRQRAQGLQSSWERVIANYLEGDLSDLDDEAMAALFEIAEDMGRFVDFTEQLVTKAGESGRRGRQEVVLRLLQALTDFVARRHPEHLDRILNQVAGVMPQLTPELVLALITAGAQTNDRAPAGIDLSSEVRSRVSEKTVADFVAHAVSRDNGATDRLAQAFQALVPDEEKRAALIDLAEREAAHLAIGHRPDFRELWKRAAEMLTSYSDDQYVSGDHGRELATLRTHALEVERVTDDPPNRISRWCQTVAQDAVRQLEHRVLVDLLEIETRPAAWQQVLESAVAAIHQQVLSENLGLAQLVLDAIVRAAEDGQPFAQPARAGLEHLRSGPLMRHVVMYLRQAPIDDVEAVAAFCRALGPSVIGTLAEVLASEQGTAVKRLRTVLLSFGAAGRVYADELRSSANPAVRRTAIELLRAFGGADALPDLAALLDDAEPAIQRDALRAIVQIGTDEAYDVLRRALESSNTATRNFMMQVLVAARDERAAPLFVYILEHSDYRGALEAVYLSAVEMLGKLGGDVGAVVALTRVLYRRHWWAPLRTHRLRSAAASALGACESEEARRALEQAAADGPRAVRRLARAALATFSAPVSDAPRRTA
jgi:HEAT repeats